MYDYLQRSDAALRKFDAGEKTSQKPLEKQAFEAGVKDYEPADYEKKESKRFHQKMHFGNSFGNLRLGVNSDGEMIFVVSGKKDMKETPSPLAARRINGNRAVEKAEGVFAENGRNPLGAVVYREEIKTRRQRELMFARIKETLEENAGGGLNDTVQTQLPFLSLKADKERLRRLNEMSAGHKCAHNVQSDGVPDTFIQSGMEKKAIDRHKIRLQREIRQKEQLKREVMAGITAAVKAPAPKKDDSIMPWLLGVLALAAAAAAATTPGEEDDSASAGAKGEAGAAKKGGASDGAGGKKKKKEI